MEANPAEAEVLDGFQDVFFVPEGRSGLAAFSDSHKFGLFIDFSHESPSHVSYTESDVDIPNILRQNIVEFEVKGHFFETLFDLFFTDTLISHDGGRVVVEDLDVITVLCNDVNRIFLFYVEGLVHQ